MAWHVFTLTFAFGQKTGTLGYLGSFDRDKAYKLARRKIALSCVGWKTEALVSTSSEWPDMARWRYNRIQ